jgi:hypothetical protein
MESFFPHNCPPEFARKCHLSSTLPISTSTQLRFDLECLCIVFMSGEAQKEAKHEKSNLEARVNQTLRLKSRYILRFLL